MKANWKRSAIATAIALGVIGIGASAQPYLQSVHGYQGMMGDGPGYRGRGDDMGPGMMGGFGPGYGAMHGYGMGPGMMYRGGPGMMWGYDGGRGGLGALERLDLTSAQREQVHRIEDDLRRKNWDLMGRMQDEMAKWRDATASGRTDRSAVLAANKRMFELRQQMLENRLDAQDKAEALLTPQQKEQYDRLSAASDGDDDD